MLLRLILCISLLFFSASVLQAWHIVGAELTYTCLSNNNYVINLKMYRDCSRDGQPGVAGWDNQIYLYVFRRNNQNRYSTFRVITIDAPNQTPKILPNGLNDCATSPINLCWEEGVYQTTLNLPPANGGYYIGWQRCCRNPEVSNLANPLNQGITFLTFIPDRIVATCNSSPVFKRRPPQFLCQNQKFEFDHSAIDSNGDSLVYELSNPFDGININGIGTSNPNPVINPFTGNSMGPPPYRNVNFQQGFNFTSPFGFNSYAFVNPKTGLLSIIPRQVGLFVVAVTVKEYRKGVLLSENKRDMQFFVLNCNRNRNQPVLIKPEQSESFRNDTAFIYTDSNRCFDFTAKDNDLNSTLKLEISNANLEVKRNGTNPINFTLCSPDPCVQNLPLIKPIYIYVTDSNQCPNFNQIRDTIYFKFIPPKKPIVKIKITHLDGSPIKSMLTRTQTHCFRINVTSEHNNQPIIFEATSIRLINYELIELSNNKLIASVCLKIPCDDSSSYAKLNLKALVNSPCFGVLEVDTTLIFRLEHVIPLKPNLNISFNPFPSLGDVSGDTIYFTQNEINMVSRLTLKNNDASITVENYSVEIINLENSLSKRYTNYTRTEDLTLELPLQLVLSCKLASKFQINIKYKLSNPCQTFIHDSIFFIFLKPSTSQKLDLALESTSVPNFIEVSKPYCLRYKIDSLKGNYSIIDTLPAFNFTNENNVKITNKQSNSFNLCFTLDCNYFESYYPLKVCVTSKDECNGVSLDCDSVLIPVKPCQLTLPNVFSPNGDGINDYFEPIENNNTYSYHLTVYDRWGNCVFNGARNEKWNGLSQFGLLCDEGVYFYTIEFYLFSHIRPKVVQKAGNITLLR